MTQRAGSWWTVSVDGFSEEDFWAPTAAKARYKAWRAIHEAGWFHGRDGFWRFLVNSRVYASQETGDPRTPEYGVAP